MAFVTFTSGEVRRGITDSEAKLVIDWLHGTHDESASQLAHRIELGMRTYADVEINQADREILSHVLAGKELQENTTIWHLRNILASETPR
jgi:hypothetical protein